MFTREQLSSLKSWIDLNLYDFEEELAVRYAAKFNPKLVQAEAWADLLDIGQNVDL